MTSPQPADPTSSPRSLPGLPDGWTARLPRLDDLAALVDLRGADKRPWTGSASVDREAVESEVAGPASWTRRQVVLVDPGGRGPRLGGRARPRRRAARCCTSTSTATTSTAPRRTGSPARRTTSSRSRRGRSAGCAAPRATRLDASPFAEDDGAARVARGRGLHAAAHLAADVAPGGARPRPRSCRGPREGVTHPPGRQPRERPARGGRPADRARDAGELLRGPLQLLPRELPRVRAAAARGPGPPLGPLVAGLRRRRRAAAGRGGAWSARCCPRARTATRAATSTTSASTATPGAAASPRRCCTR